MKKKFMVVLLTAAMIITMLSGCGGTKKENTAASGVSVTEEAKQETPKQETSKQTGTDEKVTLKFMHWWSYVTDDIIQPFLDEHPNVTIDMEYVAADQYAERIKLLSQSEELPDLFAAQSPYLAEFTQQGLVMDLTDALNTSAYQSDTTWRDTLQDSLLENVKTLFDADSAASGKDYAIPFGAVATAVVYNKTIFDKVGIKAPQTWDEFISNNDKLKKAGYIPMSFTQGAGWGGWWIHLLSDTTMPDIYAKDWAAGKVKYTDPEYVEVLSALQNLWKAGYFDPGGMTNGIEETQSLFVQGKMAQFYTVAENFVTYLVDNAPKGTEVASYAMPAYKGDKPAKSLGGAANTLCINASTKNKDIAIEFAKYLVSDKVFDMLADQGVVPSTKISNADASKAANPIMDAFATASSQGFIVPHGPSDTSGALSDLMTNDILPGLLLEGKSPKDCAESLQKTYEGLSQTK